MRKLWKGVRWEEVERHVNKNGVSSFLVFLIISTDMKLEILGSKEKRLIR